MPGPRPTMGLSNLGKGGPREAHYVTTCKLCRRGVYQTQAYSWHNSGRVLGICHDRCIEAAG